jgi:hypothetical protein
MDEHAIEIHRIYVLEEYQGKKSRANLITGSRNSASKSRCIFG